MDLPRPPEDIELRNIIDKLAQFVARNGPEFEQMTKNKQRDNLKFSFLFGGEYFNYYQFRVTTEQAINKQKYVREQSQAMSYPGSYAPPPETHNPGYARGFNNYPPGPAPAAPWPQPSHQPPPLPVHQPMPVHQPIAPFPAHNPVPPQTDLAALKGALSVLETQQMQLKEQVRQSEQNLSAQHQVVVQQQKQQTEVVVKQELEKEAVRRCHESGINANELETLLVPIMDSCTKESISQGKSWILHHVQQPQYLPETVIQYLLFKTVHSTQFVHKLHLIYLVNDVLHHCVRKGDDALLRALAPAVAQMYSGAHIAATEDEHHSKLSKLLGLWQKGNFFERGVLERLQHAPQQLWNEYQASLAVRYGAAVSAAVGGIQQTYDGYRSQHQAFVNHANHQITNLESQKQQIKDQIATVSVPPPMPDFLSRPPPLPSAPMGNFSSEGIAPSAPYFDLPAGLLVPLVKLEDSNYKSIDPKDIRLPPPLPPTERLIAAVDYFYAPASHDRPRNADGWEQLALYEFYKSKTAARKKKEEDVAQGLRELSPPPSPIINRVEEKDCSEKNGLRSPTRKRFRSESPEDSEPREESRRGRSRSGSPRRSNTSRHRDRSRSRSPSPRRGRSRSDSRSNSPFAMPSFQRQRSPTPPSEPASVSFVKGMTQKLDENNRGHQLLRKMGWGGAGLGANEQGIAEPIKGGEVRDRVDQFKGVGVDMRDPFENFRKSKGQAFVTRMRSRAEERDKEKGPNDPPTP